jgi:hypothetical protein
MGSDLLRTIPNQETLQPTTSYRRTLKLHDMVADVWPTHRLFISLTSALDRNLYHVYLLLIQSPHGVF